MGQADTSDIHLGFEFRHKVEPVNWKKIASVDIERICQELDFQTLQDNVTHVTFCNIESEVDNKNLEPSFIKLFKLSQLINEYLLNTQEYLTNNVDLLEKKIDNLESENKNLGEEINTQEKIMKELKKENRKRRRMIEDQQRDLGTVPMKTRIFQCSLCPKSFSSPFYLQNHTQRRHFESKPLKTDAGVQVDVQPRTNVEILPSKELATTRDETEKLDMIKMFEEWKKLISLEREEQKHQISSVNDQLMRELRYLKNRQEESEKELAELRMRDANNAEILRAKENLIITQHETDRRNSVDMLNLENKQREEIDQLKLLLKQQEVRFRQEVKNSIEELKQTQNNSKTEVELPNDRYVKHKRNSWTAVKLDRDIPKPRRGSVNEIGARTPQKEILHILKERNKNSPKKTAEVIKVSPVRKASFIPPSSDESDTESESDSDTNAREDQRHLTSTPVQSVDVSPKRDSKVSSPVIQGLKKELNSLVNEKIDSLKIKGVSKTDIKRTMDLLEEDRLKKSSKIPNFAHLREKWRSLISKKISSPHKTNQALVRTIPKIIPKIEKKSSFESPVRKISSPIRKKDSPKKSKINVPEPDLEKSVTLPEYRPTVSSIKAQTLRGKVKSDGAIPVKKLSFTEPEVRILNMTESSEEEDDASSDDAAVTNQKPTTAMYPQADSESQDEIETMDSDCSEEETPTERVIKVRPPTSYKVAQLASSIERQLASRHLPSSEPSLSEGKRRLAGSVDTLAPMRSYLSSSTLKLSDSYGNSMASSSKMDSKLTLDDSGSVSSIEKLMREIVSEPSSSNRKSNSQTKTKNSSWDSEIDLS